MKIILAFISLFVFIFNLSLFSQTDSIKRETSTRIQAVEDFHDVIYPIWHSYYPAKDFKALREITPEVNAKAENIYAVKLPGILREKAEKWSSGVKEFKNSVNEYTEKSKGTDDKGLLKAAEKMHSKYEMLFRIISPTLKEADDFHKTLYMIYHKYLPEMDYKNIGNLTDELLDKAISITKAKLPQRLEGKSAQFKTATEDLLTSVKKLKAFTEKGDKININKAVEKMHSYYEKLDTVLSK
jgi:hypothetical protein